MSQEHVLKTLRRLGFSQSEALIYVFLSKKGLQRGRDISRSLGLSKQQLYLSLKNLQSKGVVSATLEYPARFNAASFDLVLDLRLKAKLQEVRYIQEDRKRIMSDWNSIAFKAKKEIPATFMVLKGKEAIYSKIKRMIESSRKETLCVTSLHGLAQSDQFGIFDTAYNKHLNENVSLRLLTEWPPKTRSALKIPINCKFGHGNIRTQSNIVWQKRLPPMVVRDEEEILVFLNPSVQKVCEVVCLWTNCKAIITTFTGIFEDLWKTARGINGAFKHT